MMCHWLNEMFHLHCTPSGWSDICPAYRMHQKREHFVIQHLKSWATLLIGYLPLKQNSLFCSPTLKERAVGQKLFNYMTISVLTFSPPMQRLHTSSIVVRMTDSVIAPRLTVIYYKICNLNIIGCLSVEGLTGGRRK